MMRDRLRSDRGSAPMLRGRVQNMEWISAALGEISYGTFQNAGRASRDCRPRPKGQAQAQAPPACSCLGGLFLPCMCVLYVSASCTWKPMFSWCGLL